MTTKRACQILGVHWNSFGYGRYCPPFVGNLGNRVWGMLHTMMGCGNSGGVLGSRDWKLASLNSAYHDGMGVEYVLFDQRNSVGVLGSRDWKLASLNSPYHDGMRVKGPKIYLGKRRQGLGDNEVRGLRTHRSTDDRSGSWLWKFQWGSLDPAIGNSPPLTLIP
ncbi:hypothetical protein BCR42DRAFT_398577 [Absidia repens]|uniref:Uncharacterized protein n=1 Tax=Absidia repens TaxID=90262 RepID=A0A1X2HXV3_9FUNG|nr:hypothetical protein BCR42DRAFT_398577 [Absidia repens]